MDLVFFGHVYNYEMTWAVYQRKFRGMPKKDANGIDTYGDNNYTVPVHTIVGTGGFILDSFPKIIIVRVIVTLLLKRMTYHYIYYACSPT